MKKLPLLLLSLFFLNSPAVLAVHFANFQVADIGIGDSLLDFMSEDEILDGIEKHKDLNRYSYLNEPNKFLEIIVPREKNIYDKVSVFIKNTIPRDNTIYGIRGYRYYIEDFDACIKKRNQIAEILTNFFPDAKNGSLITEDKNKITDNFSIGNSERIIDVNCIDLEETYRLKNNFREGLEFVIRNKEYSDWALDYKWNVLTTECF